VCYYYEEDSEPFNTIYGNVLRALNPADATTIHTRSRAPSAKYTSQGFCGLYQVSGSVGVSGFLSDGHPDGFDSEITLYEVVYKAPVTALAHDMELSAAVPTGAVDASGNLLGCGRC